MTDRFRGVREARPGSRGRKGPGRAAAAACALGSLWIVLGVLAPSACTSPEPGGQRVYRAVAGEQGCAVECDPHAECVRVDGQLECVCQAGYRGDGERCEDIDECEEGLDECAEEAECINRPGGYQCECRRPEFVGDGRSCVAVDACDERLNVCDPNADCENEDDGVACTCRPGFSGDGCGCGDVDECADESAYSCAANARCVNTFGSYDCECEPGFVGDGNVECRSLCDAARESPEICGERGLCRVAGRAGRCDACEPGFTGDGRSCTAASCDALCDGQGENAPNTVCTADGSCACAPGYEGTPGACADIDECQAENGGCGAHARCVNLEGGFLCECEGGYELDESGACVDIDECARSPGPCHPDAVCTNRTPEENPQGFECACKEGFEGDGFSCCDVDECAAGDDVCPWENAECVNRRGGYDCECQAPLVGEPESCHCDLSGYWAMRQDVDVCWKALPLVEGAPEILISAGAAEATVWELHEIRYDGEEVRVRKKGCGADNAPDLVSPLFRETYSSHVPFDVYDRVDLVEGRSFAARGLVPESRFDTPREAATPGIDLGDDPENAPWPASRTDVDPAQWVDIDGDGEPGLTLWPRLPSERTESGNRNYSYTPARPGISGNNELVIEQRAGCISVGMRVITRLEATVERCDRIVGTVINESSRGRVHSCTLVPPDAWDEDITCTAEDWASQPRCTAEDLARLDDDQNQEQDSRATFDLVKVGELGDEISCGDVREALPAIERTVPTITCSTPQ